MMPPTNRIKPAPVKRGTLQKGFTLIEVMVVVTLVAILAGVGTVALSGHREEAKIREIQSVLPQIVHSQMLYFMRHNQYYSADHEELKTRGVDLSDVRGFTYATFPDENETFFVRAEATEWGSGGWVTYKHGDDDSWECDGVVIKRDWLPNYKSKKDKDKKEPPGQEKK